MEIDIFQLPGILRRRAHYIVLTVIACIILVTVFLMNQTPLFRASTELLLDPQGLVSERRDLFVTGASPQEQSSLDSQTYIVQSREVLNDVIDKLQLEKDPFFTKGLKSATENTPIARGATRAAIATAMLKRIKVERAGQSFVLSISADHPVAQKAADIANALASVYLEKANNARGDMAMRASKSFQAQASELRDKVLKAELAVEDFKAANGLVSAGAQGLVIDQQVSGISEQLIQARNAEEQQRTNYEQAKNLTISAISAGAIPEVAQSQSIELLRSRYTQLLERQSELATSLGANHPQMRAIRSQLANMQSTIEAEIGRTREALRSNYERAVANTKALTDRMASISKTSFDSSEAQSRMRQLISETDAVRAVYQTFLNRAEELSQTQSLNTNNSHVISYAVPPAASSGGFKIVILIAAGLFGVALGSGLAVLRELAGGSLVSERELIGKTGMPVLAHIPARPKQPNRLLARLVDRLPGRKGAQSNFVRQRDLGILRCVHLLLNTLGRQLPATVVFVSTAKLPLADDLVGEIAHSLAEMQQDVSYAAGHTGAQTERRRSLETRSAGSLAEAESFGDDAPVLSDLLVYKQLSGYDERHATGTPRYFTAARRSRQRSDFIIVNACGTDAAEYLPTLLKSADAIIVVTEIATAKRSELAEFMLAIEPWRQTTLGHIVIGDK
jgi:uncharacterized protein involved in exopolysaccharide biosynthesis